MIISAELENALRNADKCPEDRYVLVAPVARRIFSQSDKQCIVLLPECLRTHYGSTICHVRFRSATSADSRMRIFSVSAHRICELEQFGCSNRSETNDTLGHFTFLIDLSTSTATLGPKGYIMLQPEMRGRGVGTYTLAQLVNWVKASGFEHIRVNSGTLSEVDAKDDNRERRNSFYRNAGFDLSFTSSDCAAGSFSARNIGQLRSDWRRNKVAEATHNDLAKALVALLDTAGPLANKLVGLNASTERLQKKYSNAVRMLSILSLLLLVLVVILIYLLRPT